MMPDDVKPLTVTTWADALGSWYCEVIVAEATNAEELLGIARQAIAAELHRYRDTAETEAFLMPTQFHVENTIDGETTPVGVRYVFREAVSEPYIVQTTRTEVIAYQIQAVSSDDARDRYLMDGDEVSSATVETTVDAVDQGTASEILG